MYKTLEEENNALREIMNRDAIYIKKLEEALHEISKMNEELEDKYEDYIKDVKNMKKAYNAAVKEVNKGWENSMKTLGNVAADVIEDLRKEIDQLKK
jgi:predicted  nucleic acid-binding Zn-ribbon protein